MSTDIGNLRGLDQPWEWRERQYVVAWRRDRLVASGFAADLAAAIAERSDVDLHALLDLVDRGCPPALAARIYAPLDVSGSWE